MNVYGDGYRLQPGGPYSLNIACSHLSNLAPPGPRNVSSPVLYTTSSLVVMRSCHVLRTLGVIPCNDSS